MYSASRELFCRTVYIIFWQDQLDQQDRGLPAK